MSNMDKFNAATALILSKLYENFPQRLPMRMSDMIEDENDQRLYGDTILFLQKEGFITYETHNDNRRFDGVTLTSKGLAVLNSTPDVFQDNSTFGQRLGRATSEGSKEVLSGLINQIIQIAVTGFMKSQIG